MNRGFTLATALLARLLLLAGLMLAFQPAPLKAATDMPASHVMAGHQAMTQAMAGHDHAAMMAAQAKDDAGAAGPADPARPDHPAKTCLGKAMVCCPALAATLAAPAHLPVVTAGLRLQAQPSRPMADRLVAPLPDPPRMISV